MHVDMKDAGAAGTLPYLAMFACSNLGGWAGDHLISQRGYRVAAARKAINTVGESCSRSPASMCCKLASGLRSLSSLPLHPKPSQDCELVTSVAESGQCEDVVQLEEPIQGPRLV